MKPGKARLSPELRQQMIDAAVANPDCEVCGLLGGTGETLDSFYPVTNVDPDTRRAFLMEPREQITTMRIMREKNESLRGIFHSHPDTPAEPSNTDRQRAAYPDVYYLIVSLQSSPPDLRAWYFDGSEFTKVSISTVV